MERYSEQQIQVLNDIFNKFGSELDKSNIHYARLISARTLAKEYAINFNGGKLIICFQDGTNSFYAPFEPQDVKELVDSETRTTNSFWETK